MTKQGQARYFTGACVKRVPLPHAFLHFMDCCDARPLGPGISKVLHSKFKPA